MIALVDEKKAEIAALCKRYFVYCERLEGLLERPVDVITVRQIGNPYFRAEIDATKELIYDAETGEAAS